MLPVEIGTFSHLETRVLSAQLPEDVTCWGDVVDSVEMSRRDHVVSLRVLFDGIEMLQVSLVRRLIEDIRGSPRLILD
jgi:hypothetical protein